MLNEIEALEWVLNRFPSGYSPLVVDNGSTDGSAARAARLGARVIAESQRGFGAACFAGLTNATSEIVCFMDCDATLDPTELPLVAEPVSGGAADLVMGARPHDSTRPVANRIANGFLVASLRRRGIHLSDIGPMRAARRADLLALGMQDRRFGWPLEMVLKASDQGWRIAEVPVDHRHRVGRSKVTGTVRGTVRAALDMARALR